MKVAITSTPSVQVIGLPATLLDGRGRTLVLFKAVQKQFPSAFLFETADPQTRTPKTAVIGLGPKKILRRRFDRKLQQELVELIENDVAVVQAASFFDTLDQLKLEIKMRATNGTAPTNLDSEFASDLEIPYAFGGIFGSVGYESVREIEKTVMAAQNLETHQDSHLVSAEVMAAEDLIVINFDAMCIHSIGLKTHLALEKALALMDAPARLQVVASSGRPEVAPNRLSASIGQEDFCQKVKILKEHIRAGDIFQAVLAEKFEVETSVSAMEIFESLTEINPASYNFFFKLTGREFAGTSPESLVRVQSDIATTHPIAGTKPRGQDAKEDLKNAKSLLASRKEGAEHLMLVDLARNDLGRVAIPGTVQVTKYRELHRFSTVMHLVSEVNAQLPEGSDPIQAFRACFPAGTLTGAPKIRAMQILSGLENSRRGAYGGAVIALDPARNSLESCIAIRCFEKSNERVTLRAGAGIVADSKPLMEYAEISHKLRALRQAIFAAEAQAKLPRIPRAIVTAHETDAASVMAPGVAR